EQQNQEQQNQEQQDQEQQDQDQQDQDQQNQDQQEQDQRQQNASEKEALQEEQEKKPSQPSYADSASDQSQKDLPAAQPEGATTGYGTSHAGQTDGDLDQQEAMKMLQAIRDRDMLRRMQKLQETRSRHIPVEKDW
ncbi:MAG: hypothetical protein MK106_09345, partial [Mariniblastus sp.]|nr:hypothetical protein [Mariniblastus sp.]